MAFEGNWIWEPMMCLIRRDRRRVLLLLASEVWTVGYGVTKRRGYIPVWEARGLPMGLGRESVLGAYCLRVARNRMGDVSRKRQLEQAWGWKHEQSWQGWWKERQWPLEPCYLLSSTYHPTLDCRDKWRGSDGVPAAGEFLCWSVQSLQFFIQSKPRPLQSVKILFLLRE